MLGPNGKHEASESSSLRFNHSWDSFVNWQAGMLLLLFKSCSLSDPSGLRGDSSAKSSFKVHALSKNCAEGNIKIISFNFLAYCFCFKASSNIFKVLFDKFKASSFKVKSRPDTHPSNAKLHGQIQTSFRIQQTQVAGVQQTWHRRQRL